MYQAEWTETSRTTSSNASNTYRLGNVFRTLTKGFKSSYTASTGSQSAAYTPSFQSENGRATQFSDTDVDIILARIASSSSNDDRIAAADELADAISRTAISKNVVEIWYTAKDMLLPTNLLDVRRAGLNLLNACIVYDMDEDSASVNRLVYYRTLAEYPVGEDFDLQLKAFRALTKDGRELPVLGPSESPMVQILSTWLRVIFKDVTLARGAAKPAAQNVGADSERSQLMSVNLHNLCSYIINIFKFNFYAFEEIDIISLLKDILSICGRTSNKSDIIEGIVMINTLTVYGNLPLSMLEQSIETLCGASAVVPELFNSCWEAILHLVNSHLANNTIVALYNILREPEKVRARSAMKGAVVFLQKLLEHEPGQTKAYNITVNSVMRSYNTVMTVRDDIHIDLAVCKSMTSLILNDETYSLMAYEDYKSPDSPLVVIGLAARHAMLPIPGVKLQALEEEYHPAILINKLLLQILERLRVSYQGGSFNGPPEALIQFFLAVRAHIDEDTANIVVEYYENEYLCFPSSSGWRENSEVLLDAFFRNQSRALSLRAKVFRHMKNVYWIAREVCDERIADEFLEKIFLTIRRESDIDILSQVVDFGVDVASQIGIDGYKKLVKTFRGCMHAQNQIASNSVETRRRSVVDGGDLELHLSASSMTQNSAGAAGSTVRSISRPTTSEVSHSHSRQTLSSSFPMPRTTEQLQLASEESMEANASPLHTTVSTIIARAFVIMFIQGLERSGEKSAIIYKELLEISRWPTDWNPETIITIYRLLFRIRVNKASRVVLIQPMDMDGLAESVGRLVPSMAPEARTAAIWKHPESDSILGAPLPERASFYVTVCGNDTKTVLEEEHLPDGEPSIEEYYVNRKRGIASLNMSTWLATVVKQIKDGTSWEIYSFIIAHLAPQLSNLQLFMASQKEIQWLRSLICEQLTGQLPPLDNPKGVSKADVQVVLVRTLSSIIGYQSFFSKIDQDNIVKAVLLGLMSWERTAASCVNCLLVCSYEFPLSIKKFLSQIFANFQTKITNSGLSVHILEFLTAMARIPSLTSNFTQDDFKRVFAMSFKYMEHANDLSSSSSAKASHSNKILSQYLMALAYSVVSTWYLTMGMADRRDLAPFIVRGLLLANGNRAPSSSPGGTGQHTQNGPGFSGAMTPNDERSWALIDLISRFTYSDIALKMHTVFSGLGQDRPRSEVVGNIWIHGISILSIETFVKTGISQVVVRRPTGTTSFNIFPDSRMLPGWGDPELLLSGGASWSSTKERPGLASPLTDDTISADDQLAFLPDYFFTELAAAPEFQSVLAPTLIPNPSDPAIVRAIGMFDRTPVVEFHKIGIVYIGLNQTSEREILANSVGSKAYLDFLDGMGTLIRLRGNKQVYTGGLDTEHDIDGEYAYAWSDKITQAIFHCTTLMPSRRDSSDWTPQNGEPTYDDESLSNKKRHIGNNYVNIYWNESGKPFNFETIRSQFNFINIVISPHTKAASTFSPSSSSVASSLLGDPTESPFDFYKVRVLVQPSVDASAVFSSAASHLKMVGKDSLPLFVRNLAFNADIFAVVWHARPDDEYVSNWQYRLRQIRNLKDRINATIEKSANAVMEWARENDMKSD
ncbi:hypothetical protein V1525DRAFT_70113 [Lipomyces kononenkoae]|uniref:Uncharacterized protein n=1 Tax=Lipomyces kononenkoae TaxID=34357 RepID=A0ACC3T4Z1_LIPKO